jgi:hypothetical protein
MKKRKQRGTGYKYKRSVVCINAQQRKRQIEGASQARAQETIHDAATRSLFLLEQAYVEIMVKKYAARHRSAHNAHVAFMDYLFGNFDQAYEAAIEKMKTNILDADYDSTNCSIESASKYIINMIVTGAKGFDVDRHSGERLKRDLRKFLQGKIEFLRRHKAPPAFDDHIARSARLFWRKYRTGQGLSPDEVQQIIDGFSVISALRPHESSFDRTGVWYQCAQLVAANAERIIAENSGWGRNL